MGAISRVPVHQRRSRPKPAPPPSATALAIAALGPDATPRQVADAAHVSMQAAHKALAKARPRLADAAAACDTLSVSKMPRQLADSAAAADAISVIVTITCAQCARSFEVSTASARRRFCSDGCRNADSRERGHKPRPRRADPSHPFPAIREAAAASRLVTRGLRPCPALPANVVDVARPHPPRGGGEPVPGLPILLPCAEFSLALPVTDNAVWAGMTQTERLRRKRDAGLAAAPKPSPRNLR